MWKPRSCKSVLFMGMACNAFSKSYLKRKAASWQVWGPEGEKHSSRIKTFISPACEWEPCFFREIKFFWWVPNCLFMLQEWALVLQHMLQCSACQEISVSVPSLVCKIWQLQAVGNLLHQFSSLVCFRRNLPDPGSKLAVPLEISY